MVVFGCAVVASQDRLANLEIDLFRLVNDLPTALELPLRVVMQAGSLIAVPVASLIALGLRRPRMARDLALSGGGAWLVAKAVKALVGRGRPGTLLDNVVFHGGLDTGLGFPSGHVAVAAALAGAASPYLGRTGRRLAWSAVLVVSVARIYVGAHLPVDVIGGAALGWTIAALVHYAFGAPDGSTEPSAARGVLTQILAEPFELIQPSVDARGSVPYLVLTASGRRLFVKAVSHVQRDADLAYKVWRSITRRKLEDEAPFISPGQQAEHEAFMSMLAERAGARTPSFITTASGRGCVLVAFEWLEASPFDSLDPDDVTDGMLSSVWSEVNKLRVARIAHRDLRVANIVIDDASRPWLVDFGFAQSTASDRLLAQDVADLLASSAMAVGVDRAVGAALASVGADALMDAAPLLQPIAFSAATRKLLQHDRGMLERLRTATADAAGLPVAPLAPIARVRPRTVLLLAGSLFAIHLLLPQVGELRSSLDALRSVEPIWLIIAAICSAGTYVAAGVAQVGAVSQPLSLPLTMQVQVAATFTNRLTPANLGGAGTNVRYLQRSGLQASDAVSSVALNSVAGAIVHVAALVIAFLLVGRRVMSTAHLPSETKILVVVVGVLVVAGLALSSPPGRHRLLPQIRSGLRSVGAVLRQPARSAQLFGGSLGVTAFYVLALYTSLEAFGASLQLPQVMAVYLGAAAASSVAPTPGGLGAMEAALVAGLAFFGAPVGVSIAGVLGFRLITFWLPILPAWLVFRRLSRRQVL